MKFITATRTVYTFVGTPEAVVEGALAAARAAAALIDMSTHHGEHPRMGALDVCPFIPVQVSNCSNQYQNIEIPISTLS